MQGATTVSSAAQSCSETESLLQLSNAPRLKPFCMAFLLYWVVATQAHVSSCMIRMILQEAAMVVAVAMAVRAALKVHTPFLHQGS